MFIVPEYAAVVFLKMLSCTPADFLTSFTHDNYVKILSTYWTTKEESYVMISTSFVEL